MGKIRINPYNPNVCRSSLHKPAKQMNKNDGLHFFHELPISFFLRTALCITQFWKLQVSFSIINKETILVCNIEFNILKNMEPKTKGYAKIIYDNCNFLDNEIHTGSVRRALLEGSWGRKLEKAFCLSTQEFSVTDKSFVQLKTKWM